MAGKDVKRHYQPAILGCCTENRGAIGQRAF